MKITAALAWWCEPVPFLERLVSSLTGIVDELVAVDGVWEGVPYERASSVAAEHDAIANACITAGIPYRVIEHDGPWASQVEKRARLMELAGDTSDWILVMDGDEAIGHCDQDALRPSLELTDRHAARVTIRPLNTTWPYNRMPTREYGMPRLFRTGTTVQVAHNGYRYGTDWLLGDRAYVRIADTLDLTRVVRIDHDNMNRPADRVLASRAYSDHRSKNRTEQWTR